jgi:hypothetical protein
MARAAAPAAATAPAAVTFTAAVVILTVLPSLRGAQATNQSSPIPLFWIASRSLSSGAHSRDPLATAMTGVFIPNLLG